MWCFGSQQCDKRIKKRKEEMKTAVWRFCFTQKVSFKSKLQLWSERKASPAMSREGSKVLMESDAMMVWTSCRFNPAVSTAAVSVLQFIFPTAGVLLLLFPSSAQPDNPEQEDMCFTPSQHAAPSLVRLFQHNRWARSSQKIQSQRDTS